MPTDAADIRAAVRATYPQALAGPVLAALDDAERAASAVDAVAEAVADGQTTESAFRAVAVRSEVRRSWQWVRRTYYACGGAG